MDETNLDDHGTKDTDDNSKSDENSQSKLETQLLEKRHEEELEKLKETFSKEKLKFLETRQAEHSIGQSTSNSIQYGSASRSSVGFVEQSAHARSNDLIHSGGTTHSVQQHDGYGSHTGRRYDQNSQNFATKMVQGNTEQGSYQAASLQSRTQTHTQRQLPNVHQQGYPPQIGDHGGYLNGLGASSGYDLQSGFINGGMARSHLASNFQHETTSSSLGMNGHQNLSNAGFSQPQTNSRFYQNGDGHSTRGGTELHNTAAQVGVQNDAAPGLGYQAKMAKYSDGGYGHFAKAGHEGARVKDAHHQSSSWTPEFYTYNHSDSKENVATKSSGEKESYGVSLELTNGHAMRVNSSTLASQIRPDLDFEDRLEQQQEILQERFAEEKRHLRRSLLEEYSGKWETERRKYEESYQSLKETNLNLEYQRKESEVRIRHEREMLEMTYESRRADYERKLRKESEDRRSKSGLKYETEMQQQKVKLEGIIEKQKVDIESLTAQIAELNESLKQEKDVIVAKFESEVRDIERRLRVQMEKTESELVVKLQSKISLLTSVNKSLREEVDTKEKEKQELEMMMKDERERAEGNYESQIIEIEDHFEKEKQTLLVQYEEKIAVQLKMERSSLEQASKTASDEMISLKNENETLKKMAETTYEMQQRACSERDELVQGLIEEKGILRTQLQEAMFEQQHACDIRESQGDLWRSNTTNEREQAREVIGKLQDDLTCAEEKRGELELRVEGLMTEMELLNKKQEEGGKAKEEKEWLSAEVDKLNNEIDRMYEDVKERGKKEVVLKGKLNDVEEALGRKESENTGLKMQRMESQNTINVLERQNNDLTEDLSTLRRQKVEVEQENSGLRREKSDCQGKLSVLQTTNEDLLQELQRAKQKTSQGEEEATTLKLEKLELQQEVRMMKMHKSSCQEASRRLNTRSESDGSGSVLTSTEESGEPGCEKEFAKQRVKKRTALERQIHKLKRTKSDYESTVEKLKQDTAALEREAMKQIEHNKALSEEFVSMKKDLGKDMEKLKSAKRMLEDSVAEGHQQERIIQGQISLLEKQKKELECALEFLVEEEKRTKNENENASKTLELKEERVQREISLLETNKKGLQANIEKMESDEAELRCSIEEMQKESEILGQRISEMNESARDAPRKKVSWVEDGEMDAKLSSEFKDVKKEIAKLRRERNELIRGINELERKQTNLDISVNAAERNQQSYEKDLAVFAQKKKELESTVFSLKAEKFELETRVGEISATSLEHVTSAQRKEIEMLRSELEMTRENCESIRSIYEGVQNEGQSKVGIVEAEIKMAEDSLLTLKRERLELEKTISTLLREKTELESEVAMVVDAKYRGDRDTTALREERMDLDADVIRLKNQVSTLRNVLSSLEGAKCVTKRELESLETRKERVDLYVSGMEARLLVGQASPVSWNFNPSNDYVLTPKNDLEKQVLELREQKLSLEADLFKLRRKSGDGIDTGCRTYCGEKRAADRRVSFGYLGTAEDYGVQCTRHEDEGLQREFEALAKEKCQLSSEVTEMKVRKTHLDAQITNLEYRKLGLEQSGRLVERREDGENEGVLIEATKVTSSQEFPPKV